MTKVAAKDKNAEPVTTLSEALGRAPLLTPTFTFVNRVGGSLTVELHDAGVTELAEFEELQELRGQKNPMTRVMRQVVDMIRVRSKLTEDEIREFYRTVSAEDMYGHLTTLVSGKAPDPKVNEPE